MHVRKHSGERPFVPSLECGANAALIIESDIPQLTCTGQGFIKEYDLRVHVRKHSGERPFVPSLECGANAALIIESDIPQLTYT